MVKETRLDLNPSSLHKHKNVVLKFAISFLLMGLAFRLFVSDSFSVSSVVETTPLVETKAESPTISSLPIQAQVSVDFPDNNSQTSENVAEKCDLFTGDWVPDPSGPMYSNESCHVIEDHQNCMRNGRPDSGYLYWRWSPRDCGLPKFNPEKFLDLMRNKTWVFIGDSIARNHFQSLLCILSQVEPAVEIYHDEEYRCTTSQFPSYNFTLSRIWSPFLIKAAIFEDINGVSSAATQLHLDQLDNKWTDQYNSFDYAVIGGGKWFLKASIYHANNTVIGCHSCTGRNLTELGFDYGYRKAVQLVLKFVAGSDHKPFVFFRTTTPDHFENGEWFSGGTCNRTAPFKDGEIEMKDVDAIMHDIEVEEFEEAANVGAEKGMVMKLMDTTRLSMLRPDGHPGPYRQFQPFAEDKNAQVQNDCLHWCLPGPIDTWNDLAMEMVVNSGAYR